MTKIYIIINIIKFLKLLKVLNIEKYYITVVYVIIFENILCGKFFWFIFIYFINFIGKKKLEKKETFQIIQYSFYIHIFVCVNIS